MNKSTLSWIRVSLREATKNVDLPKGAFLRCNRLLPQRVITANFQLIGERYALFRFCEKKLISFLGFPTKLQNKHLKVVRLSAGHFCICASSCHKKIPFLNVLEGNSANDEKHFLKSDFQAIWKMEVIDWFCHRFYMYGAPPLVNCQFVITRASFCNFCNFFYSFQQLPKYSRYI